MIDFRKRLDAKQLEKKLHPVEIYESLDRKSDKGPLRPAQHAVLSTWFETLREQRDLIVKLHTGQGKTLVGLLLLQSRLNEGKGPALYLCPNS
ncbi:DEAD/DEAH box helicase family protein [Hymenobacter antarcticus]|uniref:DEAD/DEAH-box helicase domain-containing protein n=1 Tax=Hymenobacter antarcticus TaxID=486270 RepID=A0ABP7QCG3_9BACT